MKVRRVLISKVVQTHGDALRSKEVPTVTSVGLEVNVHFGQLDSDVALQHPCPIVQVASVDMAIKGVRLGSAVRRDQAHAINYRTPSHAYCTYPASQNQEKIIENSFLDAVSDKDAYQEPRGPVLDSVRLTMLGENEIATL